MGEGRAGALLLAAGCLGAAVARAEAPPEAPSPKPTSWYIIPNVGVDSDDGWGAGARFEWARRAPGHAPYKVAWVVQGYASQTGFQHHRVRFDRTGLGAAGRWRFTAHLAWRQWKNDGYWGIGNGTVREREWAGPYGFSDPERRRYRYSLFQPFAQLVGRYALGGPWSVYAAANPKFSVIETFDISLLAEHQPYGMEGGLGLQGLAGVVYDTRSPEIAPEKGILAEAGLRATPDLGGEAGGFAGGMASVRAYAPLGRRVVFAGRVMGEWLGGSVPFYEMVHWGGLVPVQGVGGFETVRGVSFGRWRAPGKAIANAELRVRAATHPVGSKGTVLGWELAPYADVATVWGAGDAATAPAPAQPVHPAVGAGLRLVFDETFVGRVDVGQGWDPILEPDGRLTQARTTGFYLAFDHPF